MNLGFLTEEEPAKSKETNILNKKAIIGYNLQDKMPEILNLEQKSNLYILIEPNYSLKKVNDSFIHKYTNPKTIPNSFDDTIDEKRSLIGFISDPIHSRLTLSEDDGKTNKTILIYENIESLALYLYNDKVDNKDLQSREKILVYEPKDSQIIREIKSSFERKYGKIEKTILY